MSGDVRHLPVVSRETNRAVSSARHLRDARADAQIAALQTLSYLAEGYERAREIADLGDLLPPSVTDGMRRLADHMEAEGLRMVFALQNGGTFR